MLDSFKLDSSSVEGVEDLIEVKFPYFALEALHFDVDGWLVAKVPVQCQSTYESSLMDVAEIGRHLAILGSCFGALANPVRSKHYYLARKADLKTYDSFVSDMRPDYLLARTKAVFASKRELVAEAELLDPAGEVAARLNVKYHVMRERSFHKIYSDSIHDITPVISDINPYSKSIDINVHNIDLMSLTASIGRVTPEMCMGHFDKVKALPVAIASQSLIKSCCIFLMRLTGEDSARFIVTSADLCADNLALAGQDVDIKVELLDVENDVFIVRTIATNNLGQSVGEMITHIAMVD
ncbi:hypothetical protein [Microbulbifer sp. ZKSA002]|uniref:hypothetical protein n=1 Tax=Microbulbifer sp. ZKSA002 TaxID=3243388 RepID=UPI00403A0B3B